MKRATTDHESIHDPIASTIQHLESAMQILHVQT